MTAKRRPRRKCRQWTVIVTRVSYYTVSGLDENDAIDRYMEQQPEADHIETTDMSAILDEVQS
jgi:hypothetical protein